MLVLSSIASNLPGGVERYQALSNASNAGTVEVTPLLSAFNLYGVVVFFAIAVIVIYTANYLLKPAYPRRRDNWDTRGPLTKFRDNMMELYVELTSRT
jgi:hypothetical protein